MGGGKFFKLRIDRIKQVPFLDALDKVAVGLDYDRSRLPYHICCPLPDHYETTGSCYMQTHRWWCFGCDRGGDVIDFAQHYFEIEKLSVVIAQVEAALGIADPESEGDAELVMKAALVRMEDGGDHTRIWEGLVWGLNDEYVDRVRPYLRHPDRMIQDRAWSVSELVFGELDTLMNRPPRTARRAREEMRRARADALGLARGVERDVEAWTGKDRLDVAMEAPPAPDLVRGLGARLIAAIERKLDE